VILENYFSTGGKCRKVTGKDQISGRRGNREMSATESSNVITKLFS